MEYNSQFFDAIRKVVFDADFPFFSLQLVYNMATAAPKTPARRPAALRAGAPAVVAVAAAVLLVLVEEPAAAVVPVPVEVEVVILELPLRVIAAPDDVPELTMYVVVGLATAAVVLSTLLTMLTSPAMML